MEGQMELSECSDMIVPFSLSLSSSCLPPSHLNGTGGGVLSGWRVLCPRQVLPQR